MSRKCALIDVLESRSLLSVASWNLPDAAKGATPTVVSGGPDGYTITIGGREITATEQLVAAGAGNSTVITSGQGPGASYGIMGSAGRHGFFVLPEVAADGSVNLEGTDEADEITVVRTTGVDDAVSERGLSASGGYVSINFIGSDGKRHIQGLMGDSSKSIAQNLARSIEGMQRAYDSGSRADPDGGKAETDEQLNSYAKSLRNLRDVQSKLATGNFIRYTLAGVYDYYVEVSPNASAAKLTINGNAGGDTISVSSNVPMKQSIYGGSGADKLTSGKKKASLFGGGGADLLVSRSAKGGTLEGGAGGDRYVAKFGDVQIVGRSDGDQVVSGPSVYVVGAAATFTLGRNDDGSLFTSVIDDEGVEHTFSDLDDLPDGLYISGSVQA